MAPKAPNPAAQPVDDDSDFDTPVRKRRAADDEDDRQDEEETDSAAPAVPLASVKPLKVDQVVKDKLPDELKLLAEEEWLYPPLSGGLHRIYRGQNMPWKHEAEIENGTNPTNPESAAITFRGSDGSAEASLGSFIAPKQGESDQRVMKMQFVMHTQVPGVKFLIKCSEASKVQVTIHANSLRRFTGTEGKPVVGFRIRSGLNLAVQKSFALKDVDVERVLETRIQLSKDRKTAPFGQPFCLPIISGITKHEIKSLESIWEASGCRFGEPTVLSLGQWILLGLLRYEDFSIYRPWPGTEAALAVSKRFSVFFCGAMWDCAVNGNFPHYQRQAKRAERAITDFEFDMSKTVPPRNLVTKWRVTYEDDQPVKAEPEQWAHFPYLAVYPDPATKAIALRLAIERGRHYGQVAIQEQLDAKAGSLNAIITPFPRFPKTYWVEITADKGEGGLFGSTNVARPALHTRVTLVIADGPHRGQEFTGTIQDDAFGRRSEMCATVVLKGPNTVPMGDYKISMDLDSDATATNRQVGAILELSRPLTRQRGVDIPALVLGVPSTIEATNALAQEVQGVDTALNTFSRALHRWTLNEQQLQAANMSLNSQSGALTIWGPPGTGKTQTELAIALGHIMAGKSNLEIEPRPVLAVAPSNSAVDSMLRKFLKVVAPNELRMCRFKGHHTKAAPSRPSTEASPLATAICQDRDAAPEQAEDGLDAIDAIWELIEAQQVNSNLDKDLVPYYFNNTRRVFIRDIKNDPQHKWNTNARYYFQKLRELRDSKASEERQQIRGELRQQEAIWDDRYLKSCDIIFCTNSSAAHLALLGSFRPVVLVSDEAAFASLSDAATPMAAFKESLQHIVMAGDHKQQGPPNHSKGVNETRLAVTTSLLEETRKDHNACEKIMLPQEYRENGDVVSLAASNGRARKRRRRRNRGGALRSATEDGEMQEPAQEDAEDAMQTD